MDSWKEEIKRRLAGLNLSPVREAEIIEELYVRALTRKPKPAELQALLALLTHAEKPDAQFYKDLFSSLLNSSEFIFNH